MYAYIVGKLRSIFRSNVKNLLASHSPGIKVKRYSSGEGNTVSDSSSINHAHKDLHSHALSKHESHSTWEHVSHQMHAASSHADESIARHHRDAATDHGLHALKFTDLTHDRHVLLNSNGSRSDRLRAAHELVENHIKEIPFTDSHGHNRSLHLAISAVDGRLRVAEASHIILEDNRGHSYTDHLRAPAHAGGVHYHAHHFTSVGDYTEPSGSHRLHSPSVDARYYNMVQNPDGSKSIGFNGCAVDTDGASRHTEDRSWQSHTSLRLSDGESLNTDLDNFVVLSPSLAKACGVKLGDLGYLVDKETGRAVPVVFGDSGPEGKRSAEASVHAIKQLGRNERVDGNHGLEGRFEVVVVPKIWRRHGRFST